MLLAVQVETSRGPLDWPRSEMIRYRKIQPDRALADSIYSLRSGQLLIQSQLFGPLQNPNQEISIFSLTGLRLEDPGYDPSQFLFPLRGPSVKTE